MKKILSTCLLLSFPLNAFCSDWETVSEIGTYSLVGLTFAKPLYDIKGWINVKKSWHGVSQAATSIGATSFLSIGANQLFGDEDGRSNKNFSSNYTANAFAAATHLYVRYGWEFGFPAYAMAGMVGYGRIESEKSEWKDVLIGAAIGSASAWFFTESKDRKVRLMPWASSKEVGMNIAYSW